MIRGMESGASLIASFPTSPILMPTLNDLVGGKCISLVIIFDKPGNLRSTIRESLLLLLRNLSFLEPSPEAGFNPLYAVRRNWMLRI